MLEIFCYAILHNTLAEGREKLVRMRRYCEIKCINEYIIMDTFLTLLPLFVWVSACYVSVYGVCVFVCVCVCVCVGGGGGGGGVTERDQ